ncbi:MAG: TolC family protein [Candidatus Zixiibacteriota bacterium]
MTRPWIAALVLLMFVITGGSARGNQAVLDSLIAEALANNPSLKAAAFEANGSRFSANAAGTLPDPEFSIGLMNLPRTSLALDEVPMSGVSLGFSQMVPWPGKLKAASRIARIDQQRDEVSIAAVRNRVIREVTDAYYDYSYWKLGEGLIDDNLELTKATVAVTEERYANGDATAHDVLMAQTTASRLEIRLLTARQMQQSAILELCRVVGDSSDAEDLSPYLPVPAVVFDDTSTISSNPYLLDADLATDRARVKRSLSRSQYWPDIMLGVDYLARKAVPGDMSPGTDWVSVHVGLSVPLWFFSKQKNNVRASEQMILSSQQQQRAVSDRLREQVEDGRLNVRVLMESLQKYDNAIVPQAKAGYDAAEIAYEVGKIDFNALLAAQVQLLDVQLERLDLVRRINRAKAMLSELYGNESER